MLNSIKKLQPAIETKGGTLRKYIDFMREKKKRGIKFEVRGWNCLTLTRTFNYILILLVQSP